MGQKGTPHADAPTKSCCGGHKRRLNAEAAEDRRVEPLEGFHCDPLRTLRSKSDFFRDGWNDETQSQRDSEG
jgi:hypothetical protein